MSGNNRILSLLGLALRGGRLAVGEEPAALAARAGQARLLLAASDAAANTLRRAEHLAEEGRCLFLTLPFTKEELGGALGRGSAAVAALTDLGLAAGVAERLAQLDPERYGGAAARMDLKRRRAAERKAAPRREPPKREPPPRGQDRHPPKPRPGEGRFHAPEGGRKPEGRRDGGERRDRPRDEGRKHGSGETRRAYGGGPGAGRPRNGRPGEPGPAKGRPPRRGGKGSLGRDKGGGR